MTVLRWGSFGLGLSLGLAFLWESNHFINGVWLPISFAAVLGLVLYSEPWIRKRKLNSAFAVAMTSAILMGFLASSRATHRRIDFTYLPALAFFPVVAGGTLASVVTIQKLPSNLKKAAWWLLLPCIMACVISVASSSAAGADDMVTWFRQTFSLTTPVAETVVHITRKSIHFLFYGSIAISGRASALIAKEKPLNAAKFGLLMTLSTATFDEMRQSTQPGRTGAFTDVLLDLSGGIVLTIIATIFASNRRPRRKLSV